MRADKSVYFPEPGHCLYLLINRALNPGSYGFSRKLRLITKSDYTQVFRKSQRYSDRFWTILVHRTTHQSTPRLGLAIAKKKARRAVDRNRLKRIARESFRYHQTDLQGVHLVVMNKDAAACVNASQLRRSMDDLLIKIACKRDTVK